MILEIAEVLDFVPEWNGNKDSDNPIVVKYKNPTMVMYEKLIPKPKLKVRVSPDGQSEGGESEVTIDNKAIVQEMVTAISNLEINDKVNGKKYHIRSPAELYGSGAPAILSGLAEEIGVYLQQILVKKAGLDAKNSE
jgi:hypothetical protein